MKFRGDQIDFLKMLNGYENIDRYNVFLKKDTRTRPLVTYQSRLDIREYIFSQRTIKME